MPIRIIYFPDAGGGSSVYSDLSDSSGILNSVSSDLADSASILSSVSSDLGDSVAILNSTSADLADSVLIYTSTSGDLADSYDIQASSTVTSDLSDSATIFNTVTSDLADSATIFANILPTSKPGYIADDTYRSFSSDDPLRVFATDDLAGGMHMAHRFPSIEVEEKVPLTFRFGAELADQGATLTSISSLAVAVRNGVADASPSSLVTTSSISGTNVVAAVDGRTAGADFELRVTCATSNPYLVLTRVGYLQVNG